MASSFRTCPLCLAGSTSAPTPAGGRGPRWPEGKTVWLYPQCSRIVPPTHLCLWHSIG